MSSTHAETAEFLQGRRRCSQAQHDPRNPGIPLQNCTRIFGDKITWNQYGIVLAGVQEFKSRPLLPVCSETAIFVIRRFLPDGKVFDASNAPGRKPIAFKLGARQVIKGWEEVLRLMNVRRTTPAVFLRVAIPGRDAGNCVQVPCLLPATSVDDELSVFYV